MVILDAEPRRQWGQAVKMSVRSSASRMWCRTLAGVHLDRHVGGTLGRLGLFFPTRPLT